jgi:hypothetical protein
MVSGASVAANVAPPNMIRRNVPNNSANPFFFIAVSLKYLAHRDGIPLSRFSCDTETIGYKAVTLKGICMIDERKFYVLAAFVEKIPTLTAREAITSARRARQRAKRGGTISTNGSMGNAEDLDARILYDQVRHLMNR